jgi:hypothetical protein
MFYEETSPALQRSAAQVSERLIFSQKGIFFQHEVHNVHKGGKRLVVQAFSLRDHRVLCGKNFFDG